MKTQTRMITEGIMSALKNIKPGEAIAFPLAKRLYVRAAAYDVKIQEGYKLRTRTDVEEQAFYVERIS